MPDAIEHILGSTVQHGALNNRIYLIRLNPDATAGVVSALDTMAEEKGYGKIIAKIPAHAWSSFGTAGYVREAVIPGFFGGQTDALFVAKYFSSARQQVRESESEDRCLKAIDTPLSPHRNTDGGPAGNLSSCTPGDAGEMSTIYRRVFESYPFPIQEPEFLKKAMAGGAAYYGIRMGGRLVSLSAADMDRHHHTAEMTDFATVAEYRGRGMAGRLLVHMDENARRSGIRTAFSITRAGSPGMNRVFKKNGYRYAGFLTNNTQIRGRIESMMVWYKPFWWASDDPASNRE
ncbi:MAG: putative beta-lysine N-acetyltransferase [Desulfobacterales bacterium]|jgi:putative beta-lysine N-acetyltransferase